MHFRHFGGTVDVEPFGQLGTLESRHGHIIYVVETLASLIGFIQIMIGLQEICNPFFDNSRFQIIFGVDARLFGDKHTHGILQQSVVGIRWFQIMLELPEDLADTVIQMFDDMEHIDADDSMGKDFTCNRDEAVVHITATNTDFYRMITKAVMWRVCPWSHSDLGNWQKYFLRSAAGITGRTSIMERASPSTMLVWYLAFIQCCLSLSQTPLSPLNSSVVMVCGSLLMVSKLIRSRME